MIEHDLGDLKLRTRETADAVVVTWTGRSNAATPGDAITPPLMAAANRAEETGAALVFAFEQLEFFNSATITVLLTLRYDEEKRWQRMFFDAFTGVGIAEGDNVRIEAVRP